MRTFWICLALSLALHLAVFGDVLESLMSTGHIEGKSKKPDRVKIRIVKRKKPPQKPKAVAVKPKPKPKAKPKVPKPKPKPKVVKPKPKVAVKPPPKPKAKPRPPKAKPKPKSYPRSKPTANRRYPQSPKAPKANRKPKTRQLNKRLTRKTTSGTSRRVAVKVPQRPSQNNGGKTGVEPEQRSPVPMHPVPEPTPDAPSEVPSGDPAGNGDGPGGEPNGGREAPEPPKPIAKPTPKPSPKPKSRVASHKDLTKRAKISVPTIELPGKFRRKKLKSTVSVRFKIKADGSYDVALRDTFGNVELEDYLVQQIRETARVTPALNKDGEPVTSIEPRVSVKISVD